MRSPGRFLLTFAIGLGFMFLFTHDYLLTATAIGGVCCSWSIVSALRNPILTNWSKTLQVAGFTAWLIESAFFPVMRGPELSPIVFAGLAGLFGLGAVLVWAGGNTHRRESEPLTP
jgi:hypothetical protein